jgi:hypothetical protein
MGILKSFGPNLVPFTYRLLWGNWSEAPSACAGNDHQRSMLPCSNIPETLPQLERTLSYHRLSAN